MVKIIVTGFGKFGPILVNPTTKLATLLKGDPTLHDSFVLEVSAQGVRATLEPLWAESETSEETTVYVHLGVHDGAKTILLEQVGYNIAHFPIPDEQGWVAQNEVIVAGQPDSIQTHLPLESYLATLKEQGIKVELSTDPGRYICNYTYFLSLVHAQKRVAKNQYALFVHVPPFSVISEDEQLHSIKTLLGLIATVGDAAHP